MSGNVRLHGAVRFSPECRAELACICGLVSQTFEESGFAVKCQNIQSGDLALVLSEQLVVELSMFPDEVETRLVIGVTAPGSDRAHVDQVRRVLLVILFRILQKHETIAVEWMSPNTVLPSAQFEAVFGDLPSSVVLSDKIASPAARHRRAPSVQEAAMAAAARQDCQDQAPAEPERATPASAPDADQPEGLVDDLPDSDIRRLATWGMTGVVLCLSGPVGISMATVNLLRGEDFRLNTQVLSLTGFLCVVTSTDALPVVMSALVI